MRSNRVHLKKTEESDINQDQDAQFESVSHKPASSDVNKKVNPETHRKAKIINIGKYKAKKGEGSLPLWPLYFNVNLVKLSYIHKVYLIDITYSILQIILPMDYYW